MLDLNTNSIPDDLPEAQELIRNLFQLNENSEKEKKAIQDHHAAQIRYLKGLLRRAISTFYGPTSEAAKSLFNEAEQVEAVSSEEDIVAVDKSKGESSSSTDPEKRRKKRKILPDYLPREEVIHDLPEAEKTCKTDGTVLVKIGEEVREEVVVKPARFFVMRHITPKYGCPKCHEGVICACPPKRILPGTVASPSILANLIINKYVDHLPLYRQEQIFKRHQIEITRATLATWIIKVGQALLPLVNLIKDEISDGPVIQCDETPLLVLKNDGVQISQKKYMWVMGRAGPPGFRPAVLYELGPGRGGDVAMRLLGDYEGFVQTDGLKTYDQLPVSKLGRRLGCMAHVRRRLVQILKSLPKDKRDAHPAKHAVRLIAKLYAIEEELRESTTDDFVALRKMIRFERATPIFEELQAYVATEIDSTSSQSPYEIALNYAANELLKVKLYLTNGECEIDNNWIENMIRPFALGRKNWLFSDTEKGADASAVIYTIVQTAKLNELNVMAYLEFILENIPNCKTLSDYEAILPWNWRP
jgi:transposase